MFNVFTDSFIAMSIALNGSWESLAVLYRCCLQFGGKFARFIAVLVTQVMFVL